MMPSDQSPNKAWHTLSPEQLFAVLQSEYKGLSSSEASSRLAHYGPNTIHRKPKDSLLQLLWRQINNPLIWVLLASGTLAIALGKMTDGLVVLAVVVINSIIGFIQEYKAGRAIEALSSMVPQNAVVLRDGHPLNVPATDLVPGDVVVLSAGESVPADMRVVSSKNLQVDEAALTGESLPVEKDRAAVAEDAVLGDRSCMVFSGTLVTAGTATAVVVATGMQTELGRISDMLETTIDLETPLTKKLSEISTWITIGIVVISVIILAAGVKRSLDMGILLGDALKETLIFAIALAVGAIPEGLPAVVTIALAIGVQRMARRNAIIRRLPAVETLGATTVICSDKTGTLTCNEMTVAELVTLEQRIKVSGIGYVPEGEFLVEAVRLAQVPPKVERLLRASVLCNDASLYQEKDEWRISGDPTEAALLVAAAKAGIWSASALAQAPRLDAIPFSSEAKAMLTLHDGARPLVVLKGAPEVVINRCLEVEDTAILEQITHEIVRMGERGMRVLALAGMDWQEGAALPADIPQQGFSFLGLVGMIDPPRAEAIAAIEACHQAGIVVKMITGDHKITAAAIGRELNLTHENKALTGAELAKLTEVELKDAVLAGNIFARVAPEHKLQLVRALQDNNQVVAMTGDGVNDAPSLKQANIGVAMGITGTAVSKEAADIVLADDNFASIGAAVEEGRRVYDNLVKSLAFLLPTNLGLALILIYGIMFFPFDPVSKVLLLPMLPTQLLWINLVAAVALALPLAFEVKEPNIMQRPPRNPDSPLFSAFVVFRVVLVSVLMTAGTIYLFDLAYAHGLQAGLAENRALPKAQTIAVTYVIFFQIFYMIHCRSLTDSLRAIGLFSNRTIFWGIGVVLFLQALFIYLPLSHRVFQTASLSPADLGLALVAAALLLPIISLEKWIRSRMNKS